MTRYGGTDRYDTARKIAAALGTTGQAVLASGEDAQAVDALAISSWAAHHGVPILFSELKVLPQATLDALTAQGVTTTVVAGGTSVIANAVLNQVHGERYAGYDRYETAQAIANGLNLNPAQVYIATGLNSIDALVAGNLAAKTNSPLLFVDTGIPRATSDYVSANKLQIGGLTMIGGTVVVSSNQESSLRGLLK